MRGGKMKTLTLRVDGRAHTVEAEDDEPLLYVLAGQLGLKGPRFGCGLAQCGSCSVLVDGVEIRSCVTPATAVAGRKITTLEGLATHVGQDSLVLHPVQQALDDEQAAQCGYCYNGIVIKAVELLSKTPNPSDAQIRTAMNGHICRCGTYPRIITAIRRAAEAMASEHA
jgi:aerobic-type carbon monoxide dehydrogenase small subunit (CoxS/CutS family)